MKTTINQKNIFGINKPKYKTTKLEIIVGPSDFDKDQPTSWNST
jgi:hypothetical protein